jgi:hypothetical protein
MVTFTGEIGIFIDWRIFMFGGYNRSLVLIPENPK